MEKQFGLKAEVISAIQQVFKTFPQIERATLYGSRAKGTYKNGSDIDLTLTAAKGYRLDLNLLFQIEEALDELMLPYLFDVSILDTIENPNLLEHIQRVGRVLYQA